jgi:nitrogen fixation NifU-like protein
MKNKYTYSKKLMKHFKKPKYVKTLKKPDGIGEVGNAACGDVMHLEIKIKKDKKIGKEKIKKIGFKTFGCPAAIASSDVVCDIAKNKTLEDAKKINKDSIIKELGGMPPIKVHCSILGIQALNKAIKDYEEKNKN